MKSFADIWTRLWGTNHHRGCRGGRLQRCDHLQRRGNNRKSQFSLWNILSRKRRPPQLQPRSRLSRPSAFSGQGVSGLRLCSTVQQKVKQKDREREITTVTKTKTKKNHFCQRSSPGDHLQRGRTAEGARFGEEGERGCLVWFGCLAGRQRYVL